MFSIISLKSHKFSDWSQTGSHPKAHALPIILYIRHLKTNAYTRFHYGQCSRTIPTCLLYFQTHLFSVERKKHIRFKARFFVIIAFPKASFFTINFLGNDYKKWANNRRALVFNKNLRSSLLPVGSTIVWPQEVVWKNLKPKSPKTKGYLISGGKRWKKLLQAGLLWIFGLVPLNIKWIIGQKQYLLKLINSLFLYYNGSDFMLNSLPHFFLA